MTYKNFFLGVCVAALFGLPAGGRPAFAAGNDIEDLMSMDIESLSKVEVSTASKKTENITDAPSVVSVITAEDIRRYGARDLNDILDRAAGIQTYGSSYYPNNIVSIRGGAMQIQNNHTLFLINGRPFRDSLSGGTVSPLLMGMPLNIIDTIEIIRGPGSVLYGSSAFNGVVNIKTKAAEKVGNGLVSGTYGSFNTHATDDAAALHGKDWNIVAGAKASKAGGWEMNVIDPAGVAGKYDTANDDQGLTLAANYKDLTFNFFHSKTTSSNLSPLSRYPVVKNALPSTFMDLGYKFDLGEKWTVSANTTYNNHRFFSASNGRSFKSDDILLEASARGALTDRLSLLAGTTYENHDSAQFNAYESDHWNTGYFQLEAQALDWLKLVGGVQLNKPADTDLAVSPRAAAIAKFGPNWGLKVMYGEAFRSPNFVETAINSPGIIIGNPDLEPETVKTTEAQLFYSAPSYQASLTVYRNEMDSLITRVGAGPITFANSRSVDFKGIELEGKANVTREISLTGNAAYQTSEDNLGREETTYAPNLMIKGGISYESPRGVTVGLYDSYFGDPSQVHDFMAVVDRNPAPKAYQLVTLNATMDLPEVLKDPSVPDATLGLFVDNLLDQDIRFPDLNNGVPGTINSIPIHSGRALYGTLTVKF